MTLLSIHPLRVTEIPAPAERAIKLYDRKPPIPGSLGETDFGRVEKLLRFQDFIIAGKATKIAAPGNGDRIGKGRHFTFLLFFDGG